MGEAEPPPHLPLPPPEQQQPTTTAEARPLRFDPSRMVGIIKRKALIKDLATVYHAECLKYCRELLELQRKWEEPYTEIKMPDDPRKEIMRQPKRPKKTS
ncbi:uncharacterized protein LOC131220729 [Magnolia sinica]|uniref:uncharacterized protein LOC131220729 n=1 Tax=Magnolia sinica TaxID=86752 RepID=UPI00265AED62|nr:uncharacterized protein LOC131220729 [Magnolia sinica]